MYDGDILQNEIALDMSNRIYEYIEEINVFDNEILLDEDIDNNLEDWGGLVINKNEFKNLVFLN